MLQFDRICKLKCLVSLHPYSFQGFKHNFMNMLLRGKLLYICTLYINAGQGPGACLVFH